MVLKFKKMLTLFSRLTLNSIPKYSRNIFTTSYQAIQTTPSLWAEPLKKKKKMDPQIIKQREDRKKKKLEKQIRRLEKNARQLKPIDELEVPLELIDEKKLRARSINPINDEENERRFLLKKQWALYKLKTKISDFRIIEDLQKMQEYALEELRKESEELYIEAIKPDLKLIPFNCKGPVSTPPIKNYISPDGEYVNISKKWQ